MPHREHVHLIGIGGTAAVLGLSSLANLIASIKVAKYLDLGENRAVLTVATYCSKLYRTEE